jgi:RND family efflux transporter MFP subunit
MISNALGRRDLVDPSVARWRLRLDRRAGAALVFGFAVLLVLGACATETAAAPAAERVLAVSTTAVEDSDHYLVERSYTGQLEPRRHARVGFDLAGTLVRARVDEGDEVGVGAILAELDTARLAARRRELEAAVAEARTAHRLAASTRGRLERAADGRAISEQDLDEAREEERAAAARLERSEAQLELVEVDLEKSKLAAPFHALVSRRLADEGQVLDAGAPIYELLEIDRPRVRLGVPPEVARELAAAPAGAALEVEAAGRRLAAAL